MTSLKSLLMAPLFVLSTHSIYSQHGWQKDVLECEDIRNITDGQIHAIGDYNGEITLELAGEGSQIVFKGAHYLDPTKTYSVQLFLHDGKMAGFKPNPEGGFRNMTKRELHSCEDRMYDIGKIIYKSRVEAKPR